MEVVRNGCDKLVCRIDKSERLVEIVMKGYIYLILQPSCKCHLHKTDIQTN